MGTTRVELSNIITDLGDHVPDDWHGWSKAHEALQLAVNQDAEALTDAVNGTNNQTTTDRIRAAKRDKGNGQKRKAEPVTVTQEQVDRAYEQLRDRANEPLLFADWHALVDGELSKPQLRKAITRLVRAGTVTETGKNRGKRYSVNHGWRYHTDSTPAIAAEAEIRPSTVPPPITDEMLADAADAVES